MSKTRGPAFFHQLSNQIASSNVALSLPRQVLEIHGLSGLSTKNARTTAWKKITPSKCFYPKVLAPIAITITNKARPRSFERIPRLFQDHRKLWANTVTQHSFFVLTVANDSHPQDHSEDEIEHVSLFDFWASSQRSSNYIMYRWLRCWMAKFILVPPTMLRISPCYYSG